MGWCRCFRMSTFWCVLSVYLIIFVKFYCAEVTNFVSVTYYENGQLETLISYKGVSAKEISTVNKNQSGLALRQISDGKRFLQLVFDEEILKDCRYILHKDQIQKFLNSFNHTYIHSLNATSRVIVDNLHDRKLPRDAKKWFSFNRMKKLCHQKHKELRSEVRKLRERRLEEIEYEKAFGRSRRDLSDLFRVPGTQWCGKGYAAKKYTDVGMFSRTDRCCRKHDLACPFWIGGFQSKYGIRNSMTNTLMHCSCDERFRACLKRVGTIDANFVGNLFFNFVQRECFTLEPKKICNKKYQNHEKRKKSQFRKRKDLNGRRSKRNEKKCRRKNAPRKAVIRRNLVY